MVIRVKVDMHHKYDFDRMIHDAAEKLSDAGHQNFVHWDSHTVDIDDDEFSPVVNCLYGCIDFYKVD